MKKLVLALIVVLPILFVIALFAITSVTRIAAAIPVTGISITNKGEANDGIFSFDIAQYTGRFEEWELGVEVLPYAAKNKAYYTQILDANTNEPTDIVTLVEDPQTRSRHFELNDIGSAKIIYYTVDGGYSDSVVFNVSSSGALDLTPAIYNANNEKIELTPLADNAKADYSVELASGSYKMGGFYRPSTVLYADADFGSDNTDVININAVSGKFNAIFSGKAILSMKIKSARKDENNVPVEIEKKVEVTVKKAEDVTVNGHGAVDGVTISQALGSKRFVMFVEADASVSPDEVSLTGPGVNAIVNKVEGVKGGFKIVVELDEAKEEDVSMRYTLSIRGTQYHVIVKFEQYGFYVYSPYNKDGTGELVMKLGDSESVAVVVEPEAQGMTYSWSVPAEFASIISISQADGDHCFVNALQEGAAKIQINWTSPDGSKRGVVERDVTVIRPITSMLFGEAAQTYGLGGFAVANGDYKDGQYVKSDYVSKFTAYNGGSVAQVSADDFSVSVSDDDFNAYFDSDGKLKLSISKSGNVTLSVSWKYGEMFGVGAASLTLYAADGVNVSTYEQLRQAMRENRETVLSNDIYLGEELFNRNSDGTRSPKYSDSEMKSKLLSYTSELPTTADWTYYKNNGGARPNVRYALEFTNSVHGNGHFISGQYITDMLDNTGVNLFDFAVFRGPLDFVAASGIASVKGQDNIVFLVRKDGVTLDNLVLRGCDQESLYDGGELVLSYLNYMGTTLEVMSDATVVNSRVMNGRTVMRVFGRDNVDGNTTPNPATEKINVTIDNCKLQNAREFLLKIGTNRVIKGTDGNISPALTDKNGDPYKNNNSPAADQNLNDEYFVSHYLLTDVTVKNSTLRTSGLFSVGMESHFAGEYLHNSSAAGGLEHFLTGWNGLAATSYPAALRLVGDVIMADWKDISSVDSSTLIEVAPNSGVGGWLALNIAQMLQEVRNNPEYANIIKTESGKTYAHGGIAFYGGGKNYSMLDLSAYTFHKDELASYNINISILANSSDTTLQNQGNMLPHAAGTEDFRFVMFDARSSFDHHAQEQLSD